MSKKIILPRKDTPGNSINVEESVNVNKVPEKCTSAYNPDRPINSVSDLTEESIVCLIGELVHIKLQLKLIVNFSCIKVSPTRANNPHLFDRMFDSLEHVLSRLGKLKS
jgi:hypothetical protein